jgi:hypothetical protein
MVAGGIYVETDAYTTIRETKNRREDDITNDMKKLKIKNWTSYIQDRNKCKLYLEG